MNGKSDWDPEHYLRFREERTQPSIDLANRIQTSHPPKRIADIGCGPGNSSRVLMQRWPESKVIGVDNSPAMIEKAKQDYPDQEWVLSGAMDFKPGIRFDIVFSNATIQWIPDHESLIGKLDRLLTENGIIAVQIPKFQDMVLGKIIEAVSQQNRWKARTASCSELFTCHGYHEYYDWLSGKMKKIEIWETDYIHILPSHVSIVDWIKSTGLRPYLDRLTDEKEKQEFKQAVLNEVKKKYPIQKNGTVLFPFKRLFFIGYKA